MKKICGFVVGIALASGVVAACGGSSSTDETTDTATAAETTTESPATTGEGGPAATAGATITIENMAFGQPLTVAPGAEITVANMDTAEHSVTSRTAGAFDVHVDGKQKGTLVAPTQPGEYQFYCIYHPSMTGTLIVK